MQPLPAAYDVRAWPAGESIPARIEPPAIQAALNEGTPVWVHVTQANDPYELGAQLGRDGLDVAPIHIARFVNPGEAVSDLRSLRLVRAARFRVATVDSMYRPDLLVSGLHILRGPGWLVTFCPPGWSTGDERYVPQLTWQELMDAVATEWRRRRVIDDWLQEVRAVDDLATLWLRWLAGSFREAATDLARFLVNADYARWHDLPSRATLDALRALAISVDTLSIHVRALQRPGYRADIAWFEPTPESEAVSAAEAFAALAEETPAYVAGLRRDIRALIDEDIADRAAEQERTRRAAEARQAARQDDLDRLAARRAERRQFATGALASVVLGPALAATVFGAFPTWMGDAPAARALTLTFISVSLAAFTAAGLLQAAKDPQGADRAAPPWHRAAVPFLAAVGIGFAVAAAAVLVHNT